MSRTLFGSALSLSLLLSASHTALAQTPGTEFSGPDFEDEVIVTGSPLARTENESLVGVSVLSGEELERRLSGNIGETLKGEPGVSSTFFGAGASRPIIRGQGGDRVRVLANGVGSIDASASSPDHAVAVEPAQAERIEVVRGAGILRYGSSGAGGVVNVIDGRIPTEVPEDTEVDFRMSATSVDQGFEAAASIDQPLGANLVLHLDGTFRDAGDYDIPGFAESALLRASEEEEEHDDDDHDEDEDHDHEEEEEEEEIRDTLPNSYVETQSITAGLSWVGDRLKIGGAISHLETEYGLPGGHEHGHGHEDEDHEDEDHEDEDHDEEEEGEEEDIFIDLDQTRLDLNATLELDGFFERLQFFGGYADYEHTEFEGPGEVGTVFSNEGYEGRLELIQAENGNWSGAHGIQVRVRDFSAIGEEAFVPPTETQQYAAYTFHRWDTDAYHIEGSARIEQTDQDNSVTGETVDFTAISFSAGGDLHIAEQVKLGATAFRTERAPATEELFADGPHLATGQFEVGDPTLGKETATGAEVTLRARGDRQSFRINAFYTDYSDYIYEVETGEEEDELPVFQFIAEDAEFYGFEAQGDMVVYEGETWALGVDGLVEYVRAKADSGDLPRIPPLSVLAGVEARKNDLMLRAEVDWADIQSNTAPFELRTDSYTLVNLYGRYDFDDRISFALGVDNVFDQDARQHASFLKDEVPLPGRNFRFTVKSSF